MPFDKLHTNALCPTCTASNTNCPLALAYASTPNLPLHEEMQFLTWFNQSDCEKGILLKLINDLKVEYPFIDWQDVVTIFGNVDKITFEHFAEYLKTKNIALRNLNAFLAKIKNRYFANEG